MCVWLLQLPLWKKVYAYTLISTLSLCMEHSIFIYVWENKNMSMCSYVYKYIYICIYVYALVWKHKCNHVLLLPYS